MVYNQILVRMGDLTLKGKNQGQFLRRLYNLIDLKLKGLNVAKEYRHDRIFITIGDENLDEIIKRLNYVSGLSSYSLVLKCSNDIEDIKVNSLKLMEEKVGTNEVTFKVDTKRANKEYPMESLEVSKHVSGYVLSHMQNLKVDVHHPEVTLHLELRGDSCYLFNDQIRLLGGFPVGVAGKGLLMLSGGIDSPVAGILAMKQGIEVECIHFESTPLTSIESAQKVVDLAKIMARYSKDDTIKIHMVPFKEIHMKLLEVIPESYHITVMRRMMYKIATEIAKLNDCLCIINGESVGQVASQTLQSMNTINSVTNMPIVRPLATTDKVDIISYSNKFGTFDISIKPFEDCCTVYVPKAPSTAPKLDKVERFESVFDFDSLIEETVKNTNTITISTDSDIDLAMHGLEVREVLKELSK
ncbi:MAG: tRNA 4-thiouridine(8) synthase ThiI [Acholeplasmatales bacterium]|nr:tRNA 4-thiouridine(8) synthase ThiI [Acholeplasmatales bacterium]